MPTVILPPIGSTKQISFLRKTGGNGAGGAADADTAMIARMSKADRLMRRGTCATGVLESADILSMTMRSRRPSQLTPSGRDGYLPAMHSHLERPGRNPSVFR